MLLVHIQVSCAATWLRLAILILMQYSYTYTYYCYEIRIILQLTLVLSDKTSFCAMIRFIYLNLRKTTKSFACKVTQMVINKVSITFRLAHA